MFQLISYQVTALRPFYSKSSILQFSILATKSITSQLVRKGYNSIICFGVCLSQLYLHLRLPTRIPTRQSQSFSPIIPILKSITIIFSTFIKPSQSPRVFTPYSVNYTTAQVPLALVSLYTFDPHAPLQRQSSQYCIAVDGFPAFFYALLWLLSLSYCCLCQPLTRLPSSSMWAWALRQHHSSSAFFTYFSNIFPTLGLLVCSPIGRPRVPPQFVQACLNILYNIRVAFILSPLHCSGFNIQLQGGQVVIQQSSTCLLIQASTLVFEQLSLTRPKGPGLSTSSQLRHHQQHGEFHQFSRVSYNRLLA